VLLLTEVSSYLVIWFNELSGSWQYRPRGIRLICLTTVYILKIFIVLNQNFTDSYKCYDGHDVERVLAPFQVLRQNLLPYTYI
jgi:hypothetical protein